MAEQGEHGIGWCTTTWNPIRGCSRVSRGCQSCYAESIAARFSGKGLPYEGLAKLVTIKGKHEARWTGKIAFVEKHLLDPLRWKNPRRVFVNSMSDLFHEGVERDWRDMIYAVMALARQHTFQILTKRPEEMRRYLSEPDFRRRVALMMLDIVSTLRKEFVLPLTSRPDSTEAQPLFWLNWPLEHIWHGVSVEDQPTAEARIPLLMRTPSAVRWISYEPALGPVSIAHFLYNCDHGANDGCEGKLDWVVCGGESGPGARPMHPYWAQLLRNQCTVAGVAFFFKQWGEWLPIATPRLAAKIGDTLLIHPDGSTKPATWNDVMRSSGDVWAVMRTGKKKAGRHLDGREWNEYPEKAAHGH